MEQEVKIQVTQSPKNILDNSLEHVGKSYRGAKDGAKLLIGNINVSPFALSELLGIYLIPSKPITDPECVLFTLHGVSYPDNINNKAHVVLTNGYTIPIDTSFRVFEKRVYYGYVLKSVTEQRTQQLKNSKKLCRT